MRGRCVPAKTREEADRLQMNRIGQSLSRIQTVEHDPAIPLHAKLKVAMREKRLVDAAADSMREFVASGDYDRLPSEWEEAKKKPDTPVQPPEELPEESGTRSRRKFRNSPGNRSSQSSRNRGQKLPPDLRCRERRDGNRYTVPIVLRAQRHSLRRPGIPA